MATDAVPPLYIHRCGCYHRRRHQQHRMVYKASSYSSFSLSVYVSLSPRFFLTAPHAMHVSKYNTDPCSICTKMYSVFHLILCIYHMVYMHTSNIIVYYSTYAGIMYNIANTSIHLFLCMYSYTYCVHYNPPCTTYTDTHSHTYISYYTLYTYTYSLKRDNAPRLRKWNKGVVRRERLHGGGAGEQEFLVESTENGRGAKEAGGKCIENDV